MHPQMLSIHVATRRIETLVTYARNARRHPPDQIQQIANSIAEFGFTLPLLIDRYNGVIAGHARLLAARQLQLTEVPVIVLEPLTEPQKRVSFCSPRQPSAPVASGRTYGGWPREHRAALLREWRRALESEDFDARLRAVEQQHQSRS